MSQLQDIDLPNLEEFKPWEDWSEVYLSTPGERIDRLEILLCQKLQRGEDISDCLTALKFLRDAPVEQNLQAIVLRKLQFKLNFDCWCKVTQTGFAFLLVIICLSGFAKIISSPNSLTPSVEQQLK